MKRGTLNEDSSFVFNCLFRYLHKIFLNNCPTFKSIPKNVMAPYFWFKNICVPPSLSRNPVHVPVNFEHSVMIEGIPDIDFPKIFAKLETSENHILFDKLSICNQINE